MKHKENHIQQRQKRSEERMRRANKEKRNKRDKIEENYKKRCTHMISILVLSKTRTSRNRKKKSA